MRNIILFITYSLARVSVHSNVVSFIPRILTITLNCLPVSYTHLVSNRIVKPKLRKSPGPDGISSTTIQRLSEQEGCSRLSCQCLSQSD